jgi:hypothetical protein
VCVCVFGLYLLPFVFCSGYDESDICEI